MSNAFLILGHATFGMLAGFLLVYTYALIHYASEENIKLIRWAGTIGAISAFIGIWLGLDFYLHSYNADKAIIKSGSWAISHAFFMETKEHVLILGIFILILALIMLWTSEPQNDESAKKLLKWLLGTLFLGSLFLEGWGAIIAFGLRVGLGAP